MKQIIFAAILIFAFCFAAFAQSNEKQLKAAKVSEYWEDPGSENGKFSIFDLYEKLQKSPNAEGLIKIQSREPNHIVQQLAKIKRLLAFGKFDLTRISFAISNKDKEIIQYWFVPLTENIPDCEDCIIIRAEDYDKLANFFYPNSKLKKRKK